MHGWRKTLAGAVAEGCGLIWMRGFAVPAHSGVCGSFTSIRFGDAGMM